MNDSNDFKKFFLEYKGAIIGGLVSAIIAFTSLLRILTILLIIVAGVWVRKLYTKK